MMAAELAVAVLSDGRTLVFEQDTALPGGAYPIGLGDLQGHIDFEAALETIKSAASRLIETFGTLAKPPEKCELTFGIKLNAAAGVILAKAGAEANFTVKMSWSATKA
jgi:hypothetical protein